jgi:putative flippase GtrA
MLPWLITIRGNHYEYEMNQLLESKAAGYDLFSIPIETIYENNNETSHFHPIKDSIRIYLPIMKFMLSSISCGMIDFVALFIFNALTRNLLFSVVAARTISSLCNYFINRTIVFNAQNQSHLSSIVKYYALVVFILICNYSLISIFVNVVGLPLVVGKLITECILYLLSYIIQHKFIFKSL